MSVKDTLLSIARSWCETEGKVHTTAEILDWVRERNENTYVSIRPISLEQCEPWYYDEASGRIQNRNLSFFQIAGLKQEKQDGTVAMQPVILQEEIGFLGVLCREIDGVMHFLMQAKIEPGNVNSVQISPTIQATLSNFTRKHGGASPPYLEYFLNFDRYEVIVDQIQSEQSARFYRKRNRNIMIRVEEDVPVLPSHCWMTLGQIKQLMRQDNLVNMDSRTVLSCIPYAKLRLTERELLDLSEQFHDKALFRSLFIRTGEDALPRMYQRLNSYKMFQSFQQTVVPLSELTDWEMKGGELVCKHPYPFRVIFCDIAIEGREVRRWTQPLFAANGESLFGLLCCEMDGVLKFLVRFKQEIGVFDTVELGPTVQTEAGMPPMEDDITELFQRNLEQGMGVMYDHMMSEEGGRFYHEQNRNVLLRVKEEELPVLPEGYFWLDYQSLNEMLQINNILNIQLRNLLALLEA